MKPKSLRVMICPYCRQPVERGSIALMQNGGWAHTVCKLDMEEARRECWEGARARDKIRAFAEAAEKDHAAIQEALKKGVK